MQKYELLSPAGDMEKLKIALHYGADAVYMGGSMLHLRAQAVDMERSDLLQACEYVHARGKKIYITINAFARNKDLDGVGAYCRSLYEMGVDAILVADLGVLTAAKKAAPDLAVHLSTQANCLNYASARAYHDMGAQRIVLARELCLEEIAEIRAKTPKDLELEAFVHGAMCMAYSGRCMLSAHLVGRDSNQGDCAQPCRWKYRLVEEQRPGQYFPIEEDAEGTYILSAYDLNTIEHLDAIRAAGVYSLKIEGRMKSPYYVATITNAYRKALEKSVDVQRLQKEIDCVSHRKFCTGFYFGQVAHGNNDIPYLQECVFSAVVQAYGDGRAVVEQRNKFQIGDELEILSPDHIGKRFRLQRMWDDQGQPLQVAQRVQQKVCIECPVELKAMDILRKRIRT